MKQINKNILNEQKQKAKDIKQELENMGRVDLGVEVSNIVYTLEKIIKGN